MRWTGGILPLNPFLSSKRRKHMESSQRVWRMLVQEEWDGFTSLDSNLPYYPQEELESWQEEADLCNLETMT